MSVKDRVAVIAGATGSLGRVVAKQFAQAGAKLALLGRTLEKVEAFAAELDLPEDYIFSHTVDVGNFESATQAASAVVNKFGRADIYLHLVGGWIGGTPLVDIPPEDMENMLQQHLWSSFHMTKAFVPHMLNNNWGRVLVISSPNAHHPKGNSTAYSVGKAAEEALFISLAEEIKTTGVTSNIIVVHAIDTDHDRENNPSEDNRYWTTPEEITATILHLCSDEARMVNGARIALYGRSL